MARKVEWTDPAWDDLAGIADYIARDSEYYAAAFVQEVKEAAASLAEFAKRGQIVPELATLPCENCSLNPIASCTEFRRIVW